jgi:hypothetical protein
LSLAAPEAVMNVRQMSMLKRWFVDHRERSPLEYHVWDAVLTMWLMGWMGVPPALLLHWSWALALCVLLYFAPPAYVRLRRRLHASGRLRCDWLGVV